MEKRKKKIIVISNIHQNNHIYSKNLTFFLLYLFCRKVHVLSYMVEWAEALLYVSLKSIITIWMI